MEGVSRRSAPSRSRNEFSVFNCAICLAKFHRDLTRNWKIPLTLPCCHVACLKCLQDHGKRNFPLTCTICKQTCDVPSGLTDSDIFKHFPPNLYMIGLCSNVHLTPCYDEPVLKYVKKSSLLPTEKKRVTCNECDTKPAELSCPRCPALYCFPCFKKTHSAVKALKDHEVKPLVPSIVTGEDDGLNAKCALHPETNLEFHCSDCDSAICSHCLIAHHNGHSMKSLSEKNQELTEPLTESFVDLTNLAERLKASLKAAQMKSYKAHKNSDTEEVEKVHNHFFLLHSKLSLIENDIIKLINDSNSVDPSLFAVIEELNASIEDVQSGLVKAKSVLIQQHYRNVNYSKLLDYLEQLKNRPSFLVSGESDESKLEVSIDETIFEKLVSHCSVKASGDTKYRLCTEDELPEGYPVEKVPTVTKEDLEEVIFNGDSRNVSSSSRDQSFEDDSSSQHSDGSRTSFNFRDIIQSSVADDLVPGVVVEGSLTHVESPSEFYFHRLNSKETLERLQVTFDYLIKIGRSRPIYPKELRIGGLYMRLYSADETWCRCKILRTQGHDKVLIFYVDYGNRACVSRFDFKTIPDKIKNIPPLALKCKLADCIPMEGREWSREALSTMLEIISLNSNEVKLHVMKKKDQCYEVDLLVPSSNGSLLSVRDSLIFLDHAKLLANLKNHEIPLPRPKQLPPQEIIPAGEPCDVVLLYVVSPDELFVEHQSPANELCKAMLNDMTKTYTLNRQKIVACFAPRPGMMVVVWSENERIWLRALIATVTDKTSIEVFCVDKGERLCVPWGNLFMMEARFYNYPALARRYKLVDVAPTFGQTWSRSATKYLRRFVKKTLRLTIVEDDGKGSVASVVDAESDDTKFVKLVYSAGFSELCLNAALVHECDDVVSTGKISRHDAVHREPAQPPLQALLTENFTDDDIDSILLDTDNSSDNNSLARHNSHAEGTPPPPRLIDGPSVVSAVPSTSDNFPPLQLPIFDETDSYVMKAEDGSCRVKVEMKRIVNPNEFYVVILKEKNKIMTLEKALNKHYENSEPIDGTDWSERVFCVAHHNGKWYRATINQINEEESTASLFLPDEGTPATVPLSNLRNLDSKFSSLRDAAVKCSLAGLVPQSGPNYALTATSELEEFVEKYKNDLYIANYSTSKNSREEIRVELLGKYRKPAGPFDPSTDSWISFNYKLWKAGFARVEANVKWSERQTLIYVHDNSAPKTEEEALMEMLTSSFKKTSDGKINFAEPLPVGSRPSNEPNSWAPPEPLPKLTFVGKTTFLTDDLVLCLQDTCNTNVQLTWISQQLTEYCQTVETQEFDYFAQNDICAARYYLDSKWYRGIIRKVDVLTGIFHVEFVDYGNVEYLEIEEIRPVNICLDIPIQSHWCYFDKLQPIEKKWNIEDVKVLHKLVVDQQCNVEVKILPDGRYGIKKMILPNGMNVEQEIVSRRFGCYTENAALKSHFKQITEQADFQLASEDDDCESSDSNESDSERLVALEELDLTPVASNSSSGRDVLLWTQMVGRKKVPSVLFEVVNIPEEVDSFIVEITTAISPTLVIAKPVDSDNDDLLDNIRLFNTMQRNLQTAAAKFPIAKPPYHFKECCAQFAEDKQWYRAIVISDKDDPTGRLLIQYVDYGNVELKSKREIRELTEKMKLICAQGIPCQLDGIEYIDKNPGREAMAVLHEHLGQTRLKATIKSRGDVIKVELSNLDGSSPYGPLVDAGILKGS